MHKVRSYLKVVYYYINDNIRLTKSDKVYMVPLKVLLNFGTRALYVCSEL